MQDSDFEELEKYQEGIRFLIQNMILKELDEILNKDIVASLLVRQSRNKLVKDLDFKALESYQVGNRFLIQNMILKELDEILNMDIAASLLVQPIQRNYCCKIHTLRH